MSTPPTSPEHPAAYYEEYIGDQLKSAAIAFIVIDTFFAGLRIASRRIGKIPLGLDDLFIAPALLMDLALCAIALYFIHIGMGHHTSPELLIPPKLEHFFKVQLVFTLSYLLGVTFPKLAILGLYLRLFRPGFYRFATYTLFGILLTSAIANCIVAGLQCRPLAYNWDKTIEGGTCVPHVDVWYLWGSFPNIVTDLAMLVLPMPVVWGLQMSNRNKIGLTLIFCTASIGLITSIIRFTYFTRVKLTEDIAWNSIRLSIYTIVEPSIYLIAACLTACQPLWNQIREVDIMASKVMLRLRTSLLHSKSSSPRLPDERDQSRGSVPSNASKRGCADGSSGSSSGTGSEADERYLVHYESKEETFNHHYELGDLGKYGGPPGAAARYDAIG